ncbi:restriction endonuclease subunit S [Brachybacterium sp. Marseille-Q7125]|uniref:restriction endonuclease subunit S n=1 Tax=Brachybacterium sp. Marseille-Q7125 TaxID=2932815 RepID=UPI001FF1ABF5|nr:restriction endonuclease subunit S [Brachybacterium sp. Marseille-Q7125]
MKPGWTEVALGEVATVVRTTVKPEAMQPEERYIGLEHIERGGRILADATVGGAQVKSTKFRFNPGQILYGKLRPNLAKIARVYVGGVCSTDILPLQVNDERLDAGYLFHYLSWQRVVDQVAARATGVNLPRISPGELAKVKFPLPPLDEQRRIAAVLDKASTLANRAKESSAYRRGLVLAKLSQELDAHRDQAETRTLADIAQVSSGITKGRKTDQSVREVPYLAVANVQDGELDLCVVKTIAATEKEIERYRLEAGDLLLTEGGDPDKLGRGYLWSGELEECLHQNHIFRVRADREKVLPVYLAYYVMGGAAKSYFLRCAKQTTGIASINMTQLRALPVPVPPVHLQEKFSGWIRQVSSVGELYRARSSAMSELFASLQSRAFRGEL